MANDRRRLRRACRHAPAWKAIDARLDLVAVDQAGRVVAAGQAGDERLEALEADVVEAAQLGHRLGVVVDADVELASVLVAVDDERRGLLAALVAAGRLARREGGEQPLGERQASGVTVGGGAGLEHLGPGEHVAGDAEVVVEEMAAPLDAALAGEGGRLAVRRSRCSWRCARPGVGVGQGPGHVDRRPAFGEQVERRRTVERIEQRLGGDRADAAPRVQAERADREEAARDRDAEPAFVVAPEDRPCHGRKCVGRERPRAPCSRAAIPPSAESPRTALRPTTGDGRRSEGPREARRTGIRAGPGSPVPHRQARTRSPAGAPGRSSVPMKPRSFLKSVGAQKFGQRSRRSFSNRELELEVFRRACDRVQEGFPDRLRLTPIEPLEHHRDLQHVVGAQANLFAPMRIQQAARVEVDDQADQPAKRRRRGGLDRHVHGAEGLPAAHERATSAGSRRPGCRRLRP